MTNLKPALKGLMDSKSIALLGFILVLVFIIGTFFGVIFRDVIVDYIGIGMHKEFKEKVMDQPATHLNSDLPNEEAK